MKGMLDLVSKLSQNAVRNILRILCNEIDTHTLGADQLHHLLDLLKENPGSGIKQKMRLVKEKYHLGLFSVPGLRQSFKQFGYHPQQKSGIHSRIVDQLLAVQNLDHTFSVAVCAKPVIDIECRLSKKIFCAFRFQGDDRSDDRSKALPGNIAVGK